MIFAPFFCIDLKGIFSLDFTKPNKFRKLKPEKFHILYKQLRENSWLGWEIKLSLCNCYQDLALDANKNYTNLHTLQVWSGEPPFFAPRKEVQNHFQMCRNGPINPVQKEKQKFTIYEKVHFSPV